MRRKLIKLVARQSRVGRHFLPDPCDSIIFQWGLYWFFSKKKGCVKIIAFCAFWLWGFSQSQTLAADSPERNTAKRTKKKTTLANAEKHIALATLKSEQHCDCRMPTLIFVRRSRVVCCRFIGYNCHSGEVELERLAEGYGCQGASKILSGGNWQACT